jgi:hypothetical protein
MAVQARLDNTTEPLILSDSSDVENGDIAQNGGRTTPLLYGTVMARIAASRYWTPWVNVAATTGAGVPRGIYLGDDIAAADMVARNVTDVPILVGDARVNEELVVFDDDILTANSIIAAASIWEITGRDALKAQANIRLQLGVAISEHEN